MASAPKGAISSAIATSSLAPFALLLAEKPILPPLIRRSALPEVSRACTCFSRLASKTALVSLWDTEKTSASSATFFACSSSSSKIHLLPALLLQKTDLLPFALSPSIILAAG